eukprot:624171-Pleurochrysis_carterae.AAC.1
MECPVARCGEDRVRKLLSRSTGGKCLGEGASARQNEPALANKSGSTVDGGERASAVGACEKHFRGRGPCGHRADVRGTYCEGPEGREH